jgi:hypothetical protein
MVREGARVEGNNIMKKLTRFAVATIFIGLIVSCAPASSLKSCCYYIDEDKIPLPSVLEFPITEFIERVVTTKKPYPGFSYALGKVNSDKLTQYIYNVPELGKYIDVSFYFDPIDNVSWSLGIYYPKVKPVQLFKPEQIGPVIIGSNKVEAFKVIAGPLKGACISDYSHEINFPLEGFTTPGDHAIVIFSKPTDESRYIGGNCE